MGNLPGVLAREIQLAIGRAPFPNQVKSSCIFWRTFLRCFIRNDLVGLCRRILKDLCRMPEGDRADFGSYKLLTASVDRMGQVVAEVYRHARQQDPSRTGLNFEAAMNLQTRVERLFEVIDQLVQSRIVGLEHLQEKAEAGCLVFEHA